MLRDVRKHERKPALQKPALQIARRCMRKNFFGAKRAWPSCDTSTYTEGAQGVGEVAALNASIWIAKGTGYALTVPMPTMLTFSLQAMKGMLATADGDEVSHIRVPTCLMSHRPMLESSA